MIRTHFGCEVEVIGPTNHKGLVIVRRKEDGKVYKYPRIELWADGGLNELITALEDAGVHDLDNQLR